MSDLMPDPAPDPLRGCAHPGLNRLLHAPASGEGPAIGWFDCPRGHPHFHDSGAIHDDMIVFPRHAVWIRHDGGAAFAADPNLVTLYNAGQVYRREAIDAYGDQSIWFRFPRATLVEACLRRGRAHRGVESAPFRAAYAYLPARPFLGQRSLMPALLAQGAAPLDALEVEEASYALLDAVLARIESDAADRAVAVPRRARRDLVEDCKRAIAARVANPDTPLRLDALAATLATTPFHLCRSFRRGTGSTIHAYAVQLRLRRAVDRMLDTPALRLTDLALDAGFASPSHFARNFRAQFGETPTAVRRRLRARGRPRRPAMDP